jgi:hypothetical protein
MDDPRLALLALQDLDQEIARAQKDLQDYEPLLQTIDQPVTTLENEIETLRTRLEETRTEARRLERGAEQKRDRLRSYEERLGRIRNAREDAAVRTELDLIRRATDADETEALEKMELSRRTDLKLDDMLKQLEKLRAEIAPRREELLRARDDAAALLAVLLEKRQNHTVRIEVSSLRLYERVRGGRTKRALAPLSAEGACGNCFNVLPIQAQSEVRREGALMRCEACGVILYPQPDGQ